AQQKAYLLQVRWIIWIIADRILPIMLHLMLIFVIIAWLSAVQDALASGVIVVARWLVVITDQVASEAADFTHDLSINCINGWIKPIDFVRCLGVSSILCVRTLEPVEVVGDLDERGEVCIWCAVVDAVHGCPSLGIC